MAEQAPRSIGPVTGATTGAAALVLIIVWLLEALFGIEVPSDVQGAATVLVVLAAGWLVPPSRPEGKHAGQ